MEYKRQNAEYGEVIIIPLNMGHSLYRYVKGAKLKFWHHQSKEFTSNPWLMIHADEEDKFFQYVADRKTKDTKAALKKRIATEHRWDDINDDDWFIYADYLMDQGYPESRQKLARQIGWTYRFWKTEMTNEEFIDLIYEEWPVPGKRNQQ